jgi:hypothetical protein
MGVIMGASKIVAPFLGLWAVETPASDSFKCTRNNVLQKVVFNWLTGNFISTATAPFLCIKNLF